ncbi:MAG TPA: lysylphosphatidylglycerol synthase domain-containing protein [Terriglobales bacterium]|nr:lysylphosphatidylglycerol synthase domain-containing protein [Terriglobales bacterium]
MKRRVTIRLVTGIAGVFLLWHLVRQVGVAQIVERVVSLRWGLVLVIGLAGVAHIVKTWAWRLTLPGDKHHVSFGRMFSLRLASEAVGQLGALGLLFGETMRVSLLSPTLPLVSGITSVTLDRAFFIISSALVGVVGTLLVIASLSAHHAIVVYAISFVTAVIVAVGLMGVGVARRWPMLAGSAGLISRVPGLGSYMQRKKSLIQSIDDKLLDFYHRTPRHFWSSFGLNLVCQAFAVLEVYVILFLLGVKFGAVAALGVEGFTKVINLAGMINPGNVGTYEAGNMLTLKLFGLTAAVGLSLAVTRRLRALFWGAVGAACLFLLSRSSKGASSDLKVKTGLPVNTSPGSQSEPKKEVDPIAGTHLAVVLADSSHGLAAPLVRVGTVPVLLRAILGAKKAGADRIVVVIDPVTGPFIQRELLKTKRLPLVEWFESTADAAPLSEALKQVIKNTDEDVILINCDETYHPSLHRRAAQGPGQGDALAMVSGNHLVGIYTVSRDLARRIGGNCPPTLTYLEDLHQWLRVNYSVQCEQVDENKWHRISAPHHRHLAERKLDRWLVKPTDGIFARTNRRISIPISHQLIKFPITANAVTLFTLAVSFSAGLFFALGGYWQALLGALLSLFSSILDGCDGEVARLKMEESDFGCWLETICDYLYYLFIFAGMTIGLTRSSGNDIYMVWGGLLVFGAIASFLATGISRRRLSKGRPDQYLKIWQTHAENRSSNILIYLGRHLEFLIRRCFLPYAILVLALLNLTNLVVILSAIGVNVVWIMALYSYYNFASSQNAVQASSTAPA